MSASTQTSAALYACMRFSNLLQTTFKEDNGKKMLGLQPKIFNFISLRKTPFSE